ncbi:hypothetical protein Gotur_021695 [Gossypium turneri]
MRDEAGKWIFGFNRFIGNLEVATAIQEGLTGGSNSALVKKILQREADRLVKLTHLDTQGLQVFELSPFGGKGYVM